MNPLRNFLTDFDESRLFRGASLATCLIVLVPLSIALKLAGVDERVIVGVVASLVVALPLGTHALVVAIASREANIPITGRRRKHISLPHPEFPISIVVPVFNEEPAIRTFYKRVDKAARQLERNYELLFIDDASTDGTAHIISQLSHADRHVRAITLHKRVGHRAALAAGLMESKGHVVVTADPGIDSPEDIVRVVHALSEGYDAVFALRRHLGRQALLQQVLLRISSLALASVSPVPPDALHSALRAYRRSVLDRLFEVHEDPVLMSFHAQSLGARLRQVVLKQAMPPLYRRSVWAEWSFREVLALVAWRLLPSIRFQRVQPVP